ncbi:hypothetical protein MKW92_020131 [Papaver armeniacum]|nr:hypothetical protein MKW92_020131 [Papaver armeniacum]
MEEIQGLENDNADKKTDMLITREEEVSKIILEEMNKETTVSTETREIVSAKNEEGLYMNIHENPTNSTPCEAEPTENMHGMVCNREDARDLDNLSEGNNLLRTPFDSVSKCIETTKDFFPNDQNVATMIDTSVVFGALAGDIPDKEENAREHEGEHIETQAITAVEESDHVKNDVPKANILKEGVKKHEEFNIQERSCESQDTQIQIPQHEETQVESVTARTGNNNTSESFVEDQSQMKTHLKQEAKVCEMKETTVNLEECNRIPQNFKRISEASDTTNREERSREVDLGKAVEKNNLEERKPRDILEINGKPKEAECGEYKESIKIEPSIRRKYSADAEDELVKEDSGSDAPVMVEASADVDVKQAHKKSHNILSGVGSKVKHSIAKVKKVITGKSSSHKSSSPKKRK